MKNLKQFITAHIDNCGEFLLYKSEIIKSISVYESGCSFKLPPANTDWCVDLFRIIHFLCYTYRDIFFVSAEESHLPGHIYLYINTNLLGI